MSEVIRKLNRDLVTKNLCKLSHVAKCSLTTHVLHEYETEKYDLMTSYVMRHNYMVEFCFNIK